MAHAPYIRWFSDLRRGDIASVGGKNASLGELTQSISSLGIKVPEGFATTAVAYWDFIETNQLKDKIATQISRLEKDDGNLSAVGGAIRGLILAGTFPEALNRAIVTAYGDMARQVGRRRPDVAVRSSATAEDLPEASFAGQLETFLNIRGPEPLLDACKRCYASLFTDRAIAYRETHGFDHMQIALSVGVQRMVRADKASSGVMFSIDTETGFPNTVIINAAWGLGETVVQGIVDPDEYVVFKPLLAKPGLKPIIERRAGAKSQKMIYARSATSPLKCINTTKRERNAFVLSEKEILQLAKAAVAIEDHYHQPMDMEWAKDGDSNDLFIVQARPETVQSRKASEHLKRYTLVEKGERLVTGLSIGDAIATGPVCRLENPGQIDQFEPGAVLVTEMTDPDWVPVMKKAAAIVTDHGGRTSHAAIVSRELGLPAVIGTGNGSQTLQDTQEVTVSCAEGDVGFVYSGTVKFEIEEIDLESLPETQTKIMINLANPAAAFRWWRLPSDGVGLARIEFIVSNIIKVHPMALVAFDKVTDRRARREIKKLTRNYPDMSEFFVDKLAQGVARIAAAHYPKPVIVRMSDFKTNEYARLIGGSGFEPDEENPMLGWRGASRYYSEGYRDGFVLECEALRQVREQIGLRNVIVMIPFCRTLKEADRVLAVMAENGLQRGEKGLEIFVMCEIPSNVILAEQFADRFDGFSIGSNDLTQLVLGVDRDSDILSALFDERDDAVTIAIADLLRKARTKGIKTGICGQAPSDHPEFAEFLVANGIDSISVTPDSFLEVKKHVAKAEKSLT